MPILSISRSRSMRKLADMLFHVEEDDACMSEGESDVSTHCGHSDAEANADEAFPLFNPPGELKDSFERQYSEASTLPGTLPFSRVPSGAIESDFEDSDEDEAPWTPPEIPESFFYRSPNEARGSLIAVARDGTCRFAVPALEEWSPEDDVEPIIAVARDGTCRFARPDGHERADEDEEPMIAVHRDGTCEFVRPIDGDTHLSYLNHLSFNPFEAEQRSSVVLVSPQGKSFYFEDSRKVDWALVEAAQ